MSTNPEASHSKRRESRAGTRKVTSLSAEQLERKRANDREAQRTIRQRTKEHIERLEHQVSELKTKGEQYDDVVRRNAALESEIRTLKHQLSMVTSGQGYSNLEGSSSTPSGYMLPSTQYPESLGVTPVSRAPSVLSTSSQVSVPHDWQQYGTTRSPSTCESSEAGYSNRVEPPYVFDGQLRAPNAMPVAASHVAYNAHGSGHPPGPAFQAYPAHLYGPGGANHAHPEEMAPHPQQAIPFTGGQRSVSVPNVSAEREAGGYPVLQSAQQYQQPEHLPRTEYSYDWVHRS
ncbi:hypothetical protein P170DRAFT_510904 [Aspergillus steynii IBT 23096]|uniref:BZIP domain-containing protein n=1 Tax=Aspergillus steynii IBT 23096 TaxID=1392250 RepID=A0A2I2G5W4_9EURO|nr:uncharacterized protein P170DRAFT_510904 [Aspergillus steynii IBT 23096]PLB48265.1 hypothetical protein P170DRAFT_510904 [Aspergillus steynii IBT 23096]